MMYYAFSPFYCVLLALLAILLCLSSASLSGKDQHTWDLSSGQVKRDV